MHIDHMMWMHKYISFSRRQLYLVLARSDTRSWEYFAVRDNNVPTHKQTYEDSFRRPALYRKMMADFIKSTL